MKIQEGNVGGMTDHEVESSTCFKVIEEVCEVEPEFRKNITKHIILHISVGACRDLMLFWSEPWAFRFRSFRFCA